MKTIMINDRVYKLLKSIKGEKSFSEIIEELFYNNLSARRKYLMKFFGILKDEEVKIREKILKEVRENARARIFRYIGDY